MGPVKLIRQFGRLLRGGANRRQILLGCILGMVIGMIPGANGTLVLAIALFFFLNANGLLAALSAVVGKGLCLLLAPVTFNIGYLIIHRMGLEGFFRWAADTPVLALMDLHVYSLIGGLPVAVVLGAVVGILADKVLRPLQLRLAGAPSNRVLAGFLRLAFGKQREVDEKRSLFRIYRVVFGVAVITALLVAVGFFSNLFIEDAVEKGGTRAVGAEVNVAGARISPTEGSLQIVGLQVTNPNRPARNWVQAERLSADVDMSALLAKSLVIDRIEGRGVRVDTPRREPGRVLAGTQGEAREPIDLSEDALLRYFEQLKQWREYLSYAKRALDYLQGPPPGERKGHLERLAGEKGYLALSAQDVLPVRPSLLIRALLVDGIEVQGRQDVYRLEGQYLSSTPSRSPAPMTVTVNDSVGELLSAELEVSPAGETRLRVHLSRVPLGQATQLSQAAPVTLKGGRADVRLEGTLRPEFRCRLVIDLTDVDLAPREGESVLGLDPATTRKIFEAVRNFTLTAELSGTIDQPRLKIDNEATLASLKQALVEAGRAELARRTDAAAEKLESEIGRKLQERVSPDVLEKARRLLPGRGTREGRSP